MKICFLTQKNKPLVEEVIRYTRNKKLKVDVYYGSRFNKLPLRISKIKYDIIISYSSPWIISKKILNKTKKWNINFHPGPPEYPGIGCYNFAIYNNEKNYGCTSHIMDTKVDCGQIIGVKRFKLSKNEKVEPLLKITYASMYILYKQVLKYILKFNKLPNSNETWSRKPYTRKELNKLSELKTNMSKLETLKRIRATYYPNKPKPFIIIKGKRFDYNPEN